MKRKKIFRSYAATLFAAFPAVLLSCKENSAAPLGEETKAPSTQEGNTECELAFGASQKKSGSSNGQAIKQDQDLKALFRSSPDLLSSALSDLPSFGHQAAAIHSVADLFSEDPSFFLKENKILSEKERDDP